MKTIDEMLSLDLLTPQQHGEIGAWIARGAAIYVCGSLQGMAAGVDAALRQIAGQAAIGELQASGRYRRDVY